MHPEEEEGVERTAAINAADLEQFLQGDSQPPQQAAPVAPAPPRPPAPPPPPPPPPAARPSVLDDEERTGALSLDDMRAAGLLDDEPEGDGATMMMQSPLADPPAPPAPPPVAARPPAPAPPQEEEGDGATMMMQSPLADPPAPPAPPAPAAPPAVEEEEEGGATMMMQSPLETAPTQDAGDDEPAEGATMMLDSPLGPPEPEPEPEAPPVVVVQKGNDKGRMFEIVSETLIGRGLDCDVVLNDASVSRKHFRIVPGGTTGWRLKDLGSGNGSKVNGERVRGQIDLTHGSIIDIGTTTILWQHEAAAHLAANPDDEATRMGAAVDFQGFGGDDGESTRVGGMAMLEELSDWSPKQGGAPGPQAAAAARPPAKKKGGGVRIFFFVFIPLLLLTGGFLAADRFAKLGIVFPVEAEAPAEAKAGGGEDAAEGEDDGAKARELMKEGLEKFKDKKWLAARKLFKKARKLDPDVEGGKAALKRVKSELASWRALENADKAVEESNFEDALAEAKKVSDESVYYEQAQKLVSQASDSLVEAALTKARELEESRKFDDALAAVEKALALSPDDSEALEIKKGIELAKADPEATAEAGGDEAGGDEAATAEAGGDAAPAAEGDQGKEGETVAAAAKPPTEPVINPRTGEPVEVAAADKPKPKPRPKAKSGGSKKPKATASAKPSKPKPAKPSGGSAKASGKVASGLSKYASGDFSGAIAALEAAADGRGNKSTKQKAARLAKSVAKFKSAYEGGMAAAKAFKASSAISKLQKARKLDAGISGAYQSRIKATLAKQYAYQANTAYASGNLGSAGNAARKALALDPSLGAAKKIYTEVQAKASTWFDQAKASAGSNPAKAMALLQKVLKVFPRTDARYGEAYALLNKLAADDEE